jgi:heat shock protein HslJ
VKKIPSLLLMMGVIGLTACAHHSGSNTALVNTYWKWVEINGAAVAVSDNQREPHIVLNAEQRVAGSDGCNRMMGGYTLAGDQLQFTQVASTRMACMQGAAQANLIGATLPQVARYKITGDEMELRDAKGAVIARFKAVALP